MRDDITFTETASQLIRETARTVDRSSFGITSEVRSSHLTARSLSTSVTADGDPTRLETAVVAT